jgi:bifunctional non-homologous end joining protein LigD
VTSLMTGRTKRQYFNLLQKDNREGVVFKRLDAPHTTGRPASGGSQLKHKFYATASCLVVAINDKKRSVSLALSEGDTSVSAGNVTIPPNVAIPRVGAVLEIRYLHAFLQSGALYQPVYLHERRDVLPSECRTSQLKYRATPSEDDEP